MSRVLPFLRLAALALPILLLAAVLAPAFTASAAEPPPRLYRDRVEPRWLPGGDKFWYRVDLPGKRKEFVLVDAARGERAPAFDHARVAEALARLLGNPVDAQALPVDSLAFAEDGKSITLQGRAGAWKLELERYELTAQPKAGGTDNALRPRRNPRPSRAGGRESAITFVNQRAEEVDLYWLREDGGRQFYGSLAPRAEREQHTYSGHAWLLAAKNGDPIATFEAQDDPGTATVTDPMEFERPPRERNADPAGIRAETTRSPDKNWELIVRGDNLFLRDVRSGDERQLTYDGNPRDSYARNVEALRAIEMEYEARAPGSPTPEVYWSPDSKRFVALRHTPGALRRVAVVQSSPEDQLQPKLVTFPYLKPGDEVPQKKPHLFDVQAKREIPLNEALFANPWSIDDLRWTPDSSEFTFVFNQRGHQILRIVGVNAQSGAVRPVVEETSKTFICYSGKFFAEYLDATNEVVWMSERDGWNHLYLYDTKTGTVKNQITKGNWVVRGVDRVDRDKRQVWFRAGGMNAGEDPYFVHYYRINFDGTGLTALTAGNGTHSVRYSPDNRFLIDTWSRVDQPPVNELRRTEDGALLCRLEEADIGELTAAGWLTPEPFVAKGRDGTTDIYGVIIRPKNFDPAKRYPVLEDIYAGPHDSFAPKEFRVNSRSQGLADRGFVIVKLDGMGTSNRSKAFHDVCWKNLGDAGFPDRIAWIKAAAARYPALDIARVGLYGTSAGGQSALRGLLDHGDFYKAGVADCGCHDNRVDKIWWNEQWMGWPLDESYVRSSNVVDAHKLTGRLLLMVGEMDKNVDPASTMQVVDALVKADKDFELLVLPNAGHGVAGTPYGARRLEDFFVRTLLDAPAK